MRFTPHDQPFPWIATDDIGAFVAIAFSAPAAYIGRSWQIAGDVRSGGEIARALARALGSAIAYEPYSEQVLAAAPLLAAVARAAAHFRPLLDLTELWQVYPAMTTLDSWLQPTSARLESGGAPRPSLHASSAGQPGLLARGEAALAAVRTDVEAAGARAGSYACDTTDEAEVRGARRRPRS